MHTLRPPLSGVEIDYGFAASVSLRSKSRNKVSVSSLGLGPVSIGCNRTAGTGGGAGQSTATGTGAQLGNRISKGSKSSGVFSIGVLLSLNVGGFLGLGRGFRFPPQRRDLVLEGLELSLQRVVSGLVMGVHLRRPERSRGQQSNG